MSSGPKGKRANTAADKADSKERAAKRADDRWGEGHAKEHLAGKGKESILSGVTRAVGRAVTGSKQKHEEAKKEAAKQDKKRIGSGQSMMTVKSNGKTGSMKLEGFDNLVTPGKWKTTNK